jgi:hypothetical protein
MVSIDKLSIFEIVIFGLCFKIWVFDEKMKSNIVGVAQAERERFSIGYCKMVVVDDAFKI